MADDRHIERAGNVLRPASFGTDAELKTRHQRMVKWLRFRSHIFIDMGLDLVILYAVDAPLWGYAAIVVLHILWALG